MRYLFAPSCNAVNNKEHYPSRAPIFAPGKRAPAGTTIFLRQFGSLRIFMSMKWGVKPVGQIERASKGADPS